MIEVREITKTFRGVTAVNKLSFSADKGEIFGVVGPDGAGKSTLLRIIASIMKPDSGNVFLDGSDIHTDPFKAREIIAYMPQKFGLYEDLTVEENIYFFGRLFGLTGKNIEKRKTALYEFSQLGPFKKRLAGRLSGGMKQKLGLACSLVHQPRLLILDEPTNGVDPVSRREFWKILYDLLSEGVTIIISSAYLDEAERCGRLAFIYKGNIISSGTPDEIKKRIDKKLLEIITTDPRKCEKIIREYFPSVILTGNSLRLFTDDTELSGKKISGLLEGKEILSLGETRPNLEDCFVELLKEGGTRL